MYTEHIEIYGMRWPADFGSYRSPYLTYFNDQSHLSDLLFSLYLYF